MVIARRAVAVAKTLQLEGGDGAIGRTALQGAIVGYCVVVTFIGAILLSAGADQGTALGVGAFGLWGGPRWGGMMAAQLHADRMAGAERQKRVRS